MSTVSEMFVSPEDSADCKPSKSEILRGFVAEKLTAAAQEILAVVERTVAGYEEEAAALRTELDRQRRQLEVLLQPQVSLWRIDEAVCKKEEPGGGELPDDEEQQTHHTDVDESREVLGPIREEDGRDEPVQSTSPDQEDQRDPHHQMPNTRLEWDETMTQTHLQLQEKTPETQRSTKSTGKERSAPGAKRAKNSLTSTEQLPPLQIKEEAADDTGYDENRPHASSVEDVESSRDDRLSRDSGWQQPMETEEDGEQRGFSEFRALYSACPAAERDEDDGDDVNDKNDEEMTESRAQPSSSKTSRKRRAECSGVKTKRGKQSPPKASADNSDAPLPCKVCQALHKTTRWLVKHAWKHVDDPERLCGVCGEHSESVEQLRNHLQSHQKTHSCSFCGRSFLSVVNLRVHASLHTGEPPYKCDVCQKTFRCRSSWTHHKWQHVTDKPYKCDVCHQSFPVKQRLLVHSMTHTDEKPHSCDVCGASVRDLQSLSQHKLIHAGENLTAIGFMGRGLQLLHK